MKSSAQPRNGTERWDVNILFFGDIVGEAATRLVIESVPELRRRNHIDFAIANAENCAPNGLGMTVKQADALIEAGIDVITGGNHSWDSLDSVDALRHPRVVRPYNLAEDVPGRGIGYLEAAGEPITVINLADRAAMHSVRATAGRFRSPHQSFAQAPRYGTVIVDYHGESVLEKQIFARAVDGEVAAVLGTHTHEPTIPLHLLPGGTGFVTDVGMTGPVGGVQGFGFDTFVAGLRTVGDPFAFGLPTPLDGDPDTEMALGAVVLEIADGRTTALRRLTQWP
jgi:2',3'-cyclic-nucleotide 2'-phosphodiesterase